MKTMNKYGEAEISPVLEDHLVGVIEGDTAGPCVIMVSGVHGNETAGVEAVKEVIKEVRPLQKEFRGNLFGIRSNLPALEQNVRFIDEDMNRLWYPAVIKKIKKASENELTSSERMEVKKLLELLDEITFRRKAPVIIADLHTFSADGCMFSISCPEKHQVELVSKLYSPMVFGIEESLRGTVLNYFQKRNFISFGIEGGQHDDETSCYNLKASMLKLLVETGCLDTEQIPDFNVYDEYLKSITQDLPVSTELVYQHIIEPGDKFIMKPGYKNFQRIKKGEWLATDKDGKIEAEADGYILMPLYQAQGDDGFFIISAQDS